MICRLWRGWTTKDNADAYEDIMRGQAIPDIEARRIPGFRSIELVRRERDHDVEFMTLMWFDNLDSVKAFMGEDYEVAHVPAEPQAVLVDFDKRSAHYEVLDHRDQRLPTRPQTPPRVRWAQPRPAPPQPKSRMPRSPKRPSTLCAGWAAASAQSAAGSVSRKASSESLTSPPRACPTRRSRSACSSRCTRSRSTSPAPIPSSKSADALSWPRLPPRIRRNWIGTGMISSASAESDDPDRLVPVFVKPEGIGLVLCGDPGRNQSKGFVQNQSHGYPAAKRIQPPADWDSMIKK